MNLFLVIYAIIFYEQINKFFFIYVWFNLSMRTFRYHSRF